MEIFGIGILEVLAVGLLMAIVFGPNRLPEIAKQGGRAVRELREYARDFRDEYLTDFEEVREEYLEVRHELKETDSEFRQQIIEVNEKAKSAEPSIQKSAASLLRTTESPDEGNIDLTVATMAFDCIDAGHLSPGDI